MSVYLIPAVGQDGKPTYLEREVAELEHVDALCRRCNNRLQRFAAPPGGGTIGVEPFFKDGAMKASQWRVIDGQPCWHLRCDRCDHQEDVTATDVAAVFAAYNRGAIPTRAWPV